MDFNISNSTMQNISNSGLLINKLVIAIAIFLLGLIVGRIVGKLLGKFLKEFKVDSLVKKHSNIKFSVEKFVIGFVSLLFYILFFIIALNYLGITSFILNILSFIIVVVIFLAIIFSIKDSLPNIFAYRTITKHLSVGNRIEFPNVKGKIIDITLLETIVETSSDDLIYIPNRLFLREIFIKKVRKKSKK